MTTTTPKTKQPQKTRKNKKKLATLKSPWRHKVFPKTCLRTVQDVKKPQQKELPHDHNVQYYHTQIRQFLLSYKIQRKFGPYAISQILNDEETLSYLMFQFMKADWLHQEDHPSGAKKQTLRYNSAKWSLYKYMEHDRRQAGRPLKSINHKKRSSSQEMCELANLLSNPKAKPPWHHIEKSEDKKKTFIILQQAGLNEREMDIIGRRFWHGEKIKHIQAIYSISKTRIYQIQQRAMEKIRKHLENDEELLEHFLAIVQTSTE